MPPDTWTNVEAIMIWHGGNSHKIRLDKWHRYLLKMMQVPHEITGITIPVGMVATGQLVLCIAPQDPKVPLQLAVT